MKFRDVIDEFEALPNDDVVNSNKKFAIGCENSYGIRLPEIRKIAKKLVKIMNLHKNYGNINIMSHTC